jgi:hypothetical protein
MWCVHFVYDPSFVILKVWAETTPGVYQASGYGDLTTNKSIWFVLHLGCFCASVFSSALHDRFWFFAARNNSETAPLITWFNGGVSGTVH